MNDLPDALAVDITYSIGGREFKLARLKSRELGQFFQVGREKVAKLARATLGDEAGIEGVAAILAIILKGANLSEIEDFTDDIDGIAQLIFLAAHKADPSVTEEDIYDRIDMGNYGEMKLLADALAMGGPIPQEGSGNPPARKAARRRSNT